MEFSFGEWNITLHIYLTTISGHKKAHLVEKIDYEIEKKFFITVIFLMKENTEYLELFIIVDTKFQQGQENLIFFQIFDILYQNIIIRE